uniref:Uncharacterized protein n=1 Tax=Strongyloides stercoralis TaxID=6248 RepID=A0A0K0EAG4_STRER
MFLILCQINNLTLKEEAYNRVINNFSKLFTRDQINQIVDYVMEELYIGTDPSTIGNNLVSKITSMLTASQYGTVTIFGTVITTKLGLQGVNNFVNVLKNVSSNNLTPFMYQIQNRMIETKGENDTKQESLNDGLYYTLTFFSKKRFLTFSCRIKKHFTNYQWKVYYPAINDIVMFNLYNNECMTSEGVV